MWSRRDLLRAAGAGAAAVALGGLGCRRGAVAAAAVEATEVGIRPALREAVAILAGALTEPVAFARVRRRWRAAVDLVAHDVWDEREELVVVAGRDRAGVWRERAIDRADAPRIVATARALVAAAPGGPGAPIVIPEARAAELAIATDPATLTVRDWRERTDDLATRATTRANSRVIYRASYVITDDERTWVVSAAGDHAERWVRSQIGAVAVAWHGSAPVAGTAVVAGGFGPEPARLTTEALAAMNAEALALTTPGAFVASDGPVVLAPAVAAAVIARAHDAAPAAAIRDVVDLPDGFASYRVDALGGAAPGPRRSDRDGRLVTAPANLVLAAGTATDLAAQLGDGYIVEGVLDEGGVGRALALRVGRVRRVAKGRTTGHAWRDVELRGDAVNLVAAIAGAGDVATAVVRDAAEVPQAVVTPAIVTVATLAPARGAA